MILTEKESSTLNYLRNPLYAIHKIKQGNGSSIDDLTNEEVISLYSKMDEIIEDEGNFRRSLGNFDEMYVIELCGVKETLLKECNKRNLDIPTN